MKESNLCYHAAHLISVEIEEVPPAVVAALAAPMGAMGPLGRATVDAGIVALRPAFQLTRWPWYLSMIDRSLDRSALGAPNEDPY